MPPINLTLAWEGGELVDVLFKPRKEGKNNTLDTGFMKFGGS